MRTKGFRVGLVAVALCVLGGWSCSSSSGQCLPNPGLCPPQFQCIDGFRRTGSASCEDGTWVCGRVACTPDASTCDGPCRD